MNTAEPLTSSSSTLLPPQAFSVENTGLDFGFLTDLAMKIVYSDANCTTERAA
jgi:hypothetical protein